MTLPGELAKVTGLPRWEAGLGNRALVKEGFQVLVYTSDDPVLAKRLKEAGAASVMVTLPVIGLPLESVVVGSE